MNEDAWIMVLAVILRIWARLMSNAEESGAVGITFLTAWRSSNRS